MYAGKRPSDVKEKECERPALWTMRFLNIIFAHVGQDSMDEQLMKTKDKKKAMLIRLVG